MNLEQIQKERNQIKMPRNTLKWRKRCSASHFLHKRAIRGPDHSCLNMEYFHHCSPTDAFHTLSLSNIHLQIQRKRRTSWIRAKMHLYPFFPISSRFVSPIMRYHHVLNGISFLLKGSDRRKRDLYTALFSAKQLGSDGCYQIFVTIKWT